MNGATASFASCIFSMNTAKSADSLLSIYSSCLICAHAATGGAVYVLGATAFLSFANCSFVGNTGSGTEACVNLVHTDVVCVCVCTLRRGNGVC